MENVIKDAWYFYYYLVKCSISCFEAEISKHFQQEGHFYFAGEKSGQRIAGFDIGGELRAESIPKGS